MENREIPQFAQFEIGDARAEIAALFSEQIYERLGVKPEEREMIGIEKYLQENPEVLNRIGAILVEYGDLKKRIGEKEKQLTSRDMGDKLMNIRNKYRFLVRESL